MQSAGSLITNPDIETELIEYLNTFPHERLLNFTSIREHIESGSGSFTEVEEILLLLESVIKRYRGESGW
ncbi:MAG: hypothetical protein PH343_05795 [Nitrospira sp.]|nr:hypothetical protein [Nitrospira sp.]